MKRENDQQLWDLLGKSPRCQASPYFARNVLRQVRQRPPSSQRVESWLNWRKLVPVSGLAVVTVAMFLAYTSSFHQKPVADDDAIARIDPQDYEVVADLDELLASDETNLWDDNSSL
jgi:hypothetical protein